MTMTPCEKEQGIFREKVLMVTLAPRTGEIAGSTPAFPTTVIEKGYPHEGNKLQTAFLLVRLVMINPDIVWAFRKGEGIPLHCSIWEYASGQTTCFGSTETEVRIFSPILKGKNFMSSFPSSSYGQRTQDPSGCIPIILVSLHFA